MLSGDSSLPLPLEHLLISFVVSVYVCVENIPGLDAPSWSRTGGVDELQDWTDELKAEREWRQRQAKGEEEIKVRQRAKQGGSTSEASENPSKLTQRQSTFFVCTSLFHRHLPLLHPLPSHVTSSFSVAV